MTEGRAQTENEGEWRSFWYAKSKSQLNSDSMRKSCLLGFCLFFVGASLIAQDAPQPVDPALLTEIRQIKIIDNHAHPPALVNPGEKDDDFDALPCDPLEPTRTGAGSAAF